MNWSLQIKNKENLYIDYCVYKFTFPSGKFIIGHTTQYLGTRLRQYLSPSSKNMTHVESFNYHDIQVDVLHQNLNEDLLKLYEQLEILDTVGHILNENGFFIPPNKINNYHMSFGCVKQSCMMNKVFDGMSLLRKYFNGEYDYYFRYKPFTFTYKW